MFPLEIETLARLLIDEARSKSLRLVAAESCTGGLVAGAICAISGASDVFERGFVTYTNRAKSEMLGVPGDLIADNGAVSEPVARMMAEGALEASNGHVAVAITGIAGPDGGQPDKPVGTVWFAIAGKQLATQAVLHRFGGDRQAVRLQSLEQAMNLILTVLR